MLILCINTIAIALYIFAKELLQWVTYLFLLLQCFCDGFVNLFDNFPVFVGFTRNILCNKNSCHGFGKGISLQKNDTCSIDLFNCTYSFNTLLSVCANIHGLIDTCCFHFYSCSYLINNTAMDSYTSVTQSISWTRFIYMFLLVQ